LVFSWQCIRGSEKVATIEGLDVDVVLAQGAGLKVQATHLDGIIQAVSALVGHAESIWHGPDARAFVGWWDQQHRPALLAAAQAVSGLGQSAINNAHDQAHTSAEQSSASSTGLGSGRPSSQGGPTPAPVARKAGEIGLGIVGAYGVLSNLAGKSNVVGRYTNSYKSFVSGFGSSLHSGGFWNYKQSPSLQEVNGSPLGKGVRRFESSFPHVAKGLDHVGNAASVVGAGVSGFAIGSDLGHGQYGDAASAGYDTTAEILKSSKNPVAYLTGVNLSVWKGVYQESQQVDWNMPMPSPFEGNNFTDIYVSGAWDGLKTFPGKLFGYLT
jgi:hypothetical protein